MPERCLDACVEQQAAHLIVKSLIIHLMEAGLLDPEELRRLLDDAVAGAAAGDDQVAAALTKRVAEIVQASYATEPQQETPLHGRGDGASLMPADRARSDRAD